MKTLSDRVLLDTNVLVHLIRGGIVGTQIASDHDLLQRSERPLISIATVGELHALAMKWNWGTEKQRKLDELVSELVVIHLGQGAVIALYAAINNFCEREITPAHPIGQNDMWIAATASATDATLLTTDHDFDHLSPRFIKLAKIDPKTGGAAA